MDPNSCTLLISSHGFLCSDRGGVGVYKHVRILFDSFPSTPLPLRRRMRPRSAGAPRSHIGLPASAVLAPRHTPHPCAHRLPHSCPPFGCSTQACARCLAHARRLTHAPQRTAVPRAAHDHRRVSTRTAAPHEHAAFTAVPHSHLRIPRARRIAAVAATSCFRDACARPPIRNAHHIPCARAVATTPWGFEHPSAAYIPRVRIRVSRYVCG
ncbi:hypothetical protein DFH09DRAFT_474965 [Mycena vulgaris]|nr:hypothetical protein DFH09DRAFT_474965 [Mycena vulgaris]